jgi:hypothetical protein
VNAPETTVVSPSIDSIVTYVEQIFHGIDFSLCVTVIYLSSSSIDNKMHHFTNKIKYIKRSKENLN